MNNTVTQDPKTFTDRVREEQVCIDLLKEQICKYEKKLRGMRRSVFHYVRAGEMQYLHGMMAEYAILECNKLQDQKLMVQALERVRQIRMASWTCVTASESEKI